jgi:hypothetical protein
MKIAHIILASLMVAGLTGTALAGSFTGADVAWQYYAYGGAYTNSFGGGTSSGVFTMPCTVCGNFDDFFLIDAGPSSITFDYSVNTGVSPWSDSVLSLPPTIHNGIDLLFSGGPTITSVAIDGATNMAGFDASRISFTGSEIQVDWHGLPFNSSTIVKLDLNGTTTPEPGSFGLLGCGLLATLGVIRRKLVR